jgi:hypothetical protein
MRGQTTSIQAENEAVALLEAVYSIENVREYNRILLEGLTARNALQRLDTSMESKRSQLFERLERKTK